MIVRWTKEQTIVALYLYCKIPFNKVSSNHPDIIKFSKLIGRSPNSLKMKIGNFGSFDPELKKRGIIGLSNTSKLDEQIWQEFSNNWENLAFESEFLLAKFQNKTIEEIDSISFEDFPEGKDRDTLIKTRINQNFFRSTILSSYNTKCCITGLSIPELLVASHIIPWSIDKNNRTNPHNGLCLNSFHDKAFDKGYITITPEYTIHISSCFNDFLKDETIKKFFLDFQNRPIILPERFLPSKEFLEYHYINIFKK